MLGRCSRYRDEWQLAVARPLGKLAVAGRGAVDTSSRQPSAMACLMLSASRGHDRLRLLSPPLARTSANVAQRCVASEIHWTAVSSGPSFFTATVTWQNRQSTGVSPALR